MNILLIIRCTIFVAFVGQIIADSAPTKPYIYEISETNRRLTIHWSEPEQWNGEKGLYNISIKYSAPTYFVPRGCDDPISLFIIITDFEKTSYRSDPLEFATQYEISVSAKSSGGWGEPDVFPYTTNDGNPEPVEQLKCSMKTDCNYRRRLVARWKTPCKANSKSLTYIIEVCRQSGEAGTSGESCESSDVTPQNATESTWYTTNVEANSKYELTIYASISTSTSTAVTCLVPQ